MTTTIATPTLPTLAPQTPADVVQADHIADATAKAGERKAKTARQAVEVVATKDALAAKGLAHGPMGKVNLAVEQLQALANQAGPVPLAEFEALAAMATKPEVAAAPLLGATVVDLEASPASVFATLTQEEWGQVLAQVTDIATPDAPVHDGEWTRLVQSAFTKLESGVHAKAAAALPPATATLAKHLTAIVQPTFLAQVAHAAFSFKRPDRVAKSSLGSMSSAMNADLPPVEMPSPMFLRIERAITDSKLSPDVDVNELAQVVMMDCANEAANDLKGLLNDMQETNRKRKKMRDFSVAQKKSRAAMEAQLRAEYNRRTGLDKGDPERIVPSLTTFDDYSAAQMLVECSDPELDEDGLPKGEVTYSISTNITYFPQDKDEALNAAGKPIEQEVVDMAGKLNLLPQTMDSLNTYWNAHKSDLMIVDPKANDLERFNSMAEWLVAPVEFGGVNLDFPAPVAKQTEVADRFLIKTAPDYIAHGLHETHGLTAEAAKKLADFWASQPASMRRSYGDDITRWMKEEQPVGPHFLPTTDSDVVDVAAVDRFLEAHKSAAAKDSLQKDYSLSDGQAQALTAYCEKAKIDPRQFMDVLPAGTSLDQKLTELSNFENSTEYTDYQKDPARTAERNAHDTWIGKAVALKKMLGLDEATSTSDLSTKVADANKDLEKARGIDALGKVSALDPKPGARTYSLGRQSALNAVNDLGGMMDGPVLEFMKTELTQLAGGALKYAYGHESMRHSATIDDDAMMGEGREDSENARAAMISKIDSLVVPAKNIAAAYVAAQLKLMEQDELAMYFVGNRDHDAKSNGYVNEFVAPHITRHITAGNVLISFRGLPGLRDIKAPSLGDMADWLAAVGEPFSTDLSGLEDCGAEPPTETFKMSESLAATVSNAKEACALLTNPVAKKTAQFATPPDKLPLLPRSDIFNLKVSVLDKPVDHSLKQPGHADVGKEMTLKMLDAQIDGWQAKYDTLGDLSQEQAIKMQMYQQRYAKFFELLSNMMKSMADLNKAIVSNLK